MASYFVGHVEVLVQFHTFCNVDLFHQGLYQIRCHGYARAPIECATEPALIAAAPLRVWQNEAMAKGSVNEREHAYYTKPFPIHFCDEEIDLNEGIVFGIEVDVSTDHRATDLFLEFSLLFTEPPPPPTCEARPSPAAEPVEAAYQCIKIRNCQWGLAAAHKLTFDSFHFSTTQLTIVAALTDIKRSTPRRDWGACAPVLPVRAFQPKAPPSLKYITRVKNASAEQTENKLIAVLDADRSVAKALDSDAPVYHTISESLGGGLQKSSLAEHEGYRISKPGEWNEPTFHDFLCLAATKEEGSTSDIGFIIRKRCDAVSKRFQYLMLRSYLVVAALTHTIVNRCLTKSEAHEYSWLTGLPPLHVPGGVTIFPGIDGLPDTKQPFKFSGATEVPKTTMSINVELRYQSHCFDFTNSHNAAGVDSDAPRDFLKGSTTFNLPVILVSERPRMRDSRRTLVTDLESALMDDVNLLWSQVSEKWHKLCLLISLSPREVAYYFELLEAVRMQEVTGRVFRSEIIERSLCHIEPDPASYHCNLADKYRQSSTWEPDVVEDCHSQFNIRSCPLVFEERYYLHGLSNAHAKSSGKSVMNMASSISSTTTNMAANHHSLLYSNAIMHEEAARQVPYSPGSVKGDWLDEAIPREHTTTSLGDSLASSSAAIAQYLPAAVTHLDPKSYEGLHLIVMVHGFKGNSYDLRIFKNYLELKFPEHVFLLSAVNENRTDDDIADQSKRLLDEIHKYITDLCVGGWSTIGRVSFVGHSLGGLIIRSTIPLFPPGIQKKLFLYMSLSSPHLGYINGKNKILDAGIWILKKIKRSTALTQICMTDRSQNAPPAADDLRGTYVFKLSQNQAFTHFKYVVLISSPQDSYVPYQSARIEYHSPSHPIYQILVQNILKDFQELDSPTLIRLDVCFKIAQKNIDSIIGRTAHINFLSSEQLAHLLTSRYAYLFA